MSTAVSHLILELFCFMPALHLLIYNPLIIFIEMEAGAGGVQAACSNLTASQGEACTLLLLGISPVLELSKNPRYFLKLNSLSLAVI